ncbi:hypothetical protein [Pseudonocardia sp. 73-21]|uniref:hypothetical protein n=1 Tax=Pseudonocardia sp. 73-21 TaxID=1895809 RepID=UPI0009651837|nr:hypothetical protein [Pseudonocardia sp. 73-21]OJY40690.1 MAG: hypothetical protein BGP03_26505 [Pseudonocardia sp. 73-21]
MAESMSLMEFLRQLTSNTGLRDWFTHDPQAALHEYGLDHLSPADVHDALVLVEDNQTADFSRDYSTSHNAIHLPPPPVHHDYATPAESHHAAMQYLNSYVTSNYVDDRHTTVDNSTNQQIDTHGGDFDQDIDVHSTVASGDGAVAAGGDIRDSTVTTGDHNQVGAGNVSGNGDVVGDRNLAVTGDHDTTAFGSGNAAGTTVGHDLTVGDGGAFASGGSAAVDNSDHSLHGVGNTWTDNSTHGSFNDSSDHSVHDSGNVGVDASTHDSSNDNSEHTTTGSFTDESDHSVVNDNSEHHVGNIDVH